jgi:hypothetical protein
MVAIKSARLKRFFFDRLKVQQAIDKATHRNLSKAGAYIMRTARGLIRSPGKKGKPSAPGKPPKNRTGKLRDKILFAFDPERRSVIVGPEQTNQVFFEGNGKPTTGTGASVLEFGGEIQVLEVFGQIATGDGKGGTKFEEGWKRADLRSKRRNAGKPTRLRKVTIAARPYMGPALAKNEKKVTAFWRDSIREAA